MDEPRLCCWPQARPAKHAKWRRSVEHALLPCHSTASASRASHYSAALVSMPQHAPGRSNHPTMQALASLLGIGSPFSSLRATPAAVKAVGLHVSVRSPTSDMSTAAAPAAHDSDLKQHLERGPVAGSCTARPMPPAGPPPPLPPRPPPPPPPNVSVEVKSGACGSTTGELWLAGGSADSQRVHWVRLLHSHRDARFVVENANGENVMRTVQCGDKDADGKGPAEKGCCKVVATGDDCLFEVRFGEATSMPVFLCLEGTRSRVALGRIRAKPPKALQKQAERKKRKRVQWQEKRCTVSVWSGLWTKQQSVTTRKENG
jgi:hypothetical protein